MKTTHFCLHLQRPSFWKASLQMGMEDVKEFFLPRKHYHVSRSFLSRHR